MKLTKLAYNCVKNVSLFDDDGFTYEKFLEINTETSQEDYFDYSVAIKNVFAPINEAISRLSDLEKIPYRVEEVAEDNGIIDLTTLLCPCKEVMNVANGNYQRLPFAPYGINKIRITRPSKLNKTYTDYVYSPQDDEFVKTVFTSSLGTLYIEYKEDIPYFTREDIETKVSFDEDDETDIITWNDDNVTDLREYGITDSMCNYIIEYAKGVLLEQIDANLANMHITRAEQYFNNIRTVSSAFNQEVVTKKYNIG